MAVPAAGWVVLMHPEITPSSNFYQTRDTTLKMACVVIFLAANYLLIGKFYGFSLLLGVAVLLAVYSLFRAGAGVAWQSANSE